MQKMGGPRALTPEEAVAQGHPGELVIATSRERILVRIQPDGTIIYGPEYTPDEAAVELWTSVAMHGVNFHARLRHMNMLELHVALIAQADQAYENAQRAAMAPDATEADKFREEMSRRAWESRVLGFVQHAREFAAHRPDLMRLVAGAPEPQET